VAENIAQTFAVQIANGCEELLAQSDLIVARVKEGKQIDSRIIERGDVAAFVKFTIEEKQEDEEAIVWTADKECDENNWAMRYPVRMKAFYSEGRESVAARRLAAFESLASGFTLKTEGRSGYLYYREDTRLLEMCVEISGTRQYSFILYWEGLDHWTHPDELTIDSVDRVRLLELIQAWLDEHDCKPNPPDCRPATPCAVRKVQVSSHCCATRWEPV